MRFPQPLGHLMEDSQRFAEAEMSLGQSVRERLPAQVLQRDVGRALVTTYRVNGHDVGVAEFRGELRLPLKSTQRVLSIDHLWRNELECHFASQLGVASEVDLTHATDAEQVDDLEVVDDHPTRQSGGGVVQTGTCVWRRGRAVFRLLAGPGNHEVMAATALLQMPLDPLLEAR